MQGRDSLRGTDRTAGAAAALRWAKKSWLTYISLQPRPFGCSSYQRIEASGHRTSPLDCYTGSREQCSGACTHTRFTQAHSSVYAYCHSYCTRNTTVQHKHTHINNVIWHIQAALVARVTVALFSLQLMELNGAEMPYRLLFVTYWPLPPPTAVSLTARTPQTGHSHTYEVMCVDYGLTLIAAVE